MTDEIKIEEITFKDNKDEILYVMIQLFAMTEEGPKVLSKIFKGKGRLDGETIGKKLEAKESNIVLLDQKQQVDDKILRLKEIIESFGYKEVKIDLVFNMMSVPK